MAPLPLHDVMLKHWDNENRLSSYSPIYAMVSELYFFLEVSRLKFACISTCLLRVLIISFPLTRYYYIINILF
jgi:hypothetical protein